MTITFLEKLRNTDDVLVHFEGMQTILVEEYGKSLEDHLSVWILDHTAEFQNALRHIYSAGHDSSAIGTQASSSLRSKPFGQAVVDRVYELNYKSARLAREVASEGHYIVGTISSSNPDFLEPLGNYTYEEVNKAYMEQIRGLVDGGVDALRIVGNHIDETLIAIKVAKDYFPDITVIAVNVFYAGKKGFRTMMGLDARTATIRLQEAGAEVIGFGCGLMTKSMHTAEWYPAATALLKEVREGTNRPLTLTPDAGLAQLIDGKTVYPATPEDMADEVMNWVEIGARIVGGCCGTSIDHGRKLAAVIKKARPL